MGLNRHRRGYATKEVGSAVHFPVSGPIGLTRSQFLISIFPHHHYCNSLGSIILKTRECQKHSTSIEPIALSRTCDPSILVIREHQGMKVSILPHATRHQSNPSNLNAYVSSNRINLDLM